uniref:hypothetical protein n=1 Tax=Vaginimicrobium propionicum TaxID=1871034 RepID=UPI00138FF678|nr:hypothetical protein [Vaginimicrobium propionicum]
MSDTDGVSLSDSLFVGRPAHPENAIARLNAPSTTGNKYRDLPITRLTHQSSAKHLLH